VELIGGEKLQKIKIPRSISTVFEISKSQNMPREKKELKFAFQCSILEYIVLYYILVRIRFAKLNDFLTHTSPSGCFQLP
jgi:hypothetical protein